MRGRGDVLGEPARVVPGRAFAVPVCRHHVRCWRHFLLWLHKPSEFPRRQPRLLVTASGRRLIEPTAGNFRGAYIPNRWNHLLARVREDHPDFRRLSFNKPRKTAGDLVRRFSDGEVAGIFPSHGQAARTDEYTNRPFFKAWAAQEKVWDHLKDIFAGDPVPEAKISIGTIRRIRAMHARAPRAGKRAEVDRAKTREAAAAAGSLPDTIRLHHADCRAFA